MMSGKSDDVFELQDPKSIKYKVVDTGASPSQLIRQMVGDIQDDP